MALERNDTAGSRNAPASTYATEEDVANDFGGWRGNVHPPGKAPLSKTADAIGCVHFIDSICKSHRLQVRSSYGAELLAVVHGVDDAYPTILTLHEVRVCKQRGLTIKVTLTTDAESV